MYQCHTENNPETRTLFLQFPKRLYQNNVPQDIQTEKQILSGNHPLSNDFRIYPFVVTKDGCPICRSILTVYEEDDCGYVGFFESEDDLEAVRYLFDTIGKKAKELHKTTLVGPLDASIFIRYRFKLDHFHDTYTGEPINLPYYPRLWENCGFQVKDRYVSNQLRAVTASDLDVRYERVYQRYMEKGYQFISPTRKTFSNILLDVYDLLMDRFAEFPGYKPINQEQFITLFGSLRIILNYEMVRLVYKNNKLYAFCICIPNYGSLTSGKITISKLIRLLSVKKKPSEYVIMYAGASPAAPGLGCALIQDIRNILYQNQCTSIGALIHEGKLTEKMYEELRIDQRNYGLYQKDLNGKNIPHLL